MKRALIVLLLTAGAAIAGPPSVTLPKEVAGEVGQWVIVPVETKDAGPVRWLSTVDPGLSEVPLAALFGDEWAAKAKGRVFTAKAPGRFRVFAWAGGDNRDSTGAAVCVVVVGGAPPAPTPGPTPPPGPQPDGTLGLIKASREGMARVTVADKAKQAVALAAKQKAHAAAVAAGAFAGPAAILDGWRAANREAVNAADWAPWGFDVSAKLTELFKAGKLAGNAEWAAAFREIGDGLGG